MMIVRLQRVGLFLWDIPVRTFTLRADLWLFSLASGEPFMPTSLTAIAEKSHFSHSWHYLTLVYDVK